jgi:hypothetical protein
MKSWREDIRQHIRDWRGKLGNLSWWPLYIYHFTDVQNAAKIISDGIVYCRAEALLRNSMIVDNASPEIIAQTNSEHLNYVRLYFRPKTPTQYHNEGIRPQGERGLGAHCPVPIFFCFDALELLSLDQVEFSDGNMASSKAVHSNSQEFFRSIPFNYVFHSGAFPPEFRDEIIFRRHAEVLVPKKLGFTHLKFIACRSAAERQTLLHLLPDDIAQNFKDKVRLGMQGFFERKWTHVEEVVVVNHEITFRLNPNSQIPGPFNVKIEYCEQGKRTPQIWEKKFDKIGPSLSTRLPNATWGEIKLFLDDALAFSDIIFLEDIPF